MTDPLERLRAEGPSPEAESAALGAWLLGDNEGVTTVAPGPARDCAPGEVMLRHVPFARDADRIAFLSGDGVCVVERADAQVEPHDNLAGDARDTVVVSGGVATCPQTDADALLLRGAL